MAEQKIGIGTGVKLGIGMFIVLPVILFVLGAVMFVAFLGTAASKFDSYKRQVAAEHRLANEQRRLDELNEALRRTREGRK